MNDEMIEPIVMQEVTDNTASTSPECSEGESTTKENIVEEIPKKTPEASNEIVEEESLEALKETITSLREKISELEKAKDTQERMLKELNDFTSLFPEVSVESIPESVWESVKNGTSLSASYALYEKRIMAEAMKIEQINYANAVRSAGVAGKNTANEFFTPDEVRKMSRAEVHANFSKIKRSMQKWK